MKITNIDFYFDGGSARIETDEGTYFVDRRLNTNTPNTIYDRYPDENGANVVGNMQEELVAELTEYNDPIYSKAIGLLINDLSSDD